MRKTTIGPVSLQATAPLSLTLSAFPSTHRLDDLDSLLMPAYRCSRLSTRHVHAYRQGINTIIIRVPFVCLLGSHLTAKRKKHPHRYSS